MDYGGEASASNNAVMSIWWDWGWGLYVIIVWFYILLELNIGSKPSTWQIETSIYTCLWSNRNYFVFPELLAGETINSTIELPYFLWASFNNMWAHAWLLPEMKYWHWVRLYVYPQIPYTRKDKWQVLLYDLSSIILRRKIAHRIQMHPKLKAETNSCRWK